MLNINSHIKFVSLYLFFCIVSFPFVSSPGYPALSRLSVSVDQHFRNFFRCFFPEYQLVSYLYAWRTICILEWGV